MLLITIVKVGTTANEQERIAVLEKQSPWNTNMGDWATFYVSVVKYLYIVVFFYAKYFNIVYILHNIMYLLKQMKGC